MHPFRVARHTWERRHVTISGHHQSCIYWVGVPCTAWHLCFNSLKTYQHSYQIPRQNHELHSFLYPWIHTLIIAIIIMIHWHTYIQTNAHVCCSQFSCAPSPVISPLCPHESFHSWWFWESQLLDVFHDYIPLPPCVGSSVRSFHTFWNLRYCIICNTVMASNVAKNIHAELM